MLRATAVRVVIYAATTIGIAPRGDASAGELVRPNPVQVVPAPVIPPALEPDDLPEPRLEVIKQRAKIDPPATPLFEQVPSPKQPRLEISLDVISAAPMRPFVDRDTRNRSVDHLNACNKAVGAHDYATAVIECRAATEIWDGNHLAWYALTTAQLAQRAWSEALTAAERTVTLRADQSMYQLYYGIALYETARRQIDLDAAAGEAPSAVQRKLETARDALAIATRKTPELWRAHYYLGHVYNELRDPKRAAAQLVTAIQFHPGYRLAYRALIDLYLRWDYLGPAEAIAGLATSYLPAAESADLWFDIGLAYEPKQTTDDKARQSSHEVRVADSRALEAYGKALAIYPQHGGARIQRALHALRKGDIASGKRALDDVARSSDPQHELASRVLEQLDKLIDPSERRALNCRHTRTGISCR